MNPSGYGSWPSAITAQALAVGAIRLGYGCFDAGSVYWSEGHPDQGGRVGLWELSPAGTRQEVVSDLSVGNSINEYGGGAWQVRAGITVFSSLPSGEVWLIEDGLRRRLAAGGELRFGCFEIVPERRLVLAVREDHRPEGFCEQAVVALDLDSLNLDGGQVLASGADFYASPTLDQTGRLAWVQWDLPDMPWDSSQLWVAPLTEPTTAQAVLNRSGVSALHPRWSSTGQLIYLSDASGYWNFQSWDGGSSQPLHQHEFDFCLPMWNPDPAPYSLLADGRIGCSWIEAGRSQVGMLTPADQDRPARLERLDTGAVSAELSGSGSQVVALLGYPERPAELRLLDLTTGSSQLLQQATSAELPPDQISLAQELSWESPDGPVHAWYYPPTNSDLTGLPGELPPVQVWSHGGPTALADPSFRLTTQFWTSRGIGILDVNYSGSAGYGRAYRERLARNWGVSDVRDCVAGAAALVAAGLADPKRLSIRGSSAGGYTTLAALTSSEAFAAGISLYGIADLEPLANSTHKFEARYLDRLVAPYPEGVQVYRERSPIHHLDRLNCPMLILQGEADRVVPPSQARAMAAAVQAKGLPVELILFETEGHGFRQADSIITTAWAALEFLGRVHGFEPATTGVERK